MRHSRGSNARWVERLEQRLEASEQRQELLSEDDLACLNEAELMLASGEAGEPPRDDTFIELAISRALSKRGRSAREISEKIAAYSDRGRGDT